MHSEKQDNIILNRRAAILCMGGLGLFSVLGARLYYLQVAKAENYTALSEKNRFNFSFLIPSRGRILDRNGDVLAMNKQDYRLVIIPEQIQDLSGTLDRISDVISLSKATRSRIERDIKDHAKFVPILIEDHLDWDKFAALNMQMHELPGVVPEVGEGRSYPYHGTFAHVLGYVGRADPEDVEKDNDPLLRQPTFRIGKTGVEAAADKTLRGKSGKLKVEVNAMGRVVREWPESSVRAVAGDDVWLTLDSELQSYAAELFEEESGGVAVIDILTGELRTLLSMPTFDGNVFVSGLTRTDMQRLNEDEKRPQFNKVIGGGYPPASTFKMMAMLAGLEAGHIDPNEHVICTGHIEVGNRKFHCWHRRGGHGPVNLKQSLQHSCDVYYYEMAHRIKMSQILDMSERMGLGQKFDIGIAGQSSGLIPTPEWKEARLGQQWRMGDSLNAIIGQGFVLTTPLQLAVMTARIANGVHAVLPQLIIGENQPKFKPLAVNPDHLKLVQNAMLAVCEEPGGTAYRRNPMGVKGVQMAGKTGTGQVKGISSRERSTGILGNNSLPWKLRDHSIFVGYAPYDAPRFAIGTVVEHGGSGAGRAADITRALLKRVLERDGLLPAPVATIEKASL